MLIRYEDVDWKLKVLGSHLRSHGDVAKAAGRTDQQCGQCNQGGALWKSTLSFPRFITSICFNILQYNMINMTFTPMTSTVMHLCCVRWVTFQHGMCQLQKQMGKQELLGSNMEYRPQQLRLTSQHTLSLTLSCWGTAWKSWSKKLRPVQNRHAAFVMRYIEILWVSDSLWVSEKSQYVSVPVSPSSAPGRFKETRAKNDGHARRECQAVCHMCHAMTSIWSTDCSAVCCFASERSLCTHHWSRSLSLSRSLFYSIFDSIFFFSLSLYLFSSSSHLFSLSSLQRLQEFVHEKFFELQWRSESQAATPS